MKSKFIFFALILTKLATPQSTFFVQTQGTHIFNSPQDFVVKPDNSILFLNTSIADNSHICDNNIYQVSSEGEIQSIITYTDTTSIYVHYTHILNVDDTLYVFGWGQKNLPGLTYPYIFMQKMDMQLNLINNYEFNIGSLTYVNDISHGQVKYVGETFIYLASTGDGGSVITCFYVEISKSGKLLTLEHDDESVCVQIPFDFIQTTDHDSFYVFTFINLLQGYGWGGFLYNYDKKLDVKSFSLLANNFLFYFTALPINDSIFYLSGTWSDINGGDPPIRLGIMKMKTDGTVLDQKLFATSPGLDTADNTSYRNSLDYLPDGNLLICSNHNIDIQQIPQLEPSYIRLIKLTPELDVLWERFIGNSNGKYDAFVMKTTPDDEIIIFGAWSPAPPVNWHYTELLFIKTNGEGLFTSTNDYPGLISSEAILYPNPAGDVVNIEFSQLYQAANFYLMDIGGKMVLEKQLTSNRQTIDISALPAGTYVYRISNPKGMEETGKLVVE